MPLLESKYFTPNGLLTKENVWLIQFVPPSVVRIIKPPEPTTIPTLLSIKQIRFKSPFEGQTCLSHVFPPSLVWKILPPIPINVPWPASENAISRRLYDV